MKFTNFQLQCQEIRILMEFEFTYSPAGQVGQSHKVAVEFEDGRYFVYLGDKKFEVDVQWLSEDSLSLIIDNKVHTAYIVEDKERKYVAINGEQFCFAEARPGSEKRYAADSAPVEVLPSQGKQFVSSPMPGTVIKINVAEGEEVEKNQSLIVVEAMKMENEIRSPIKGKVKKINCTAGDLVGVDEPIIELETEEAAKS